MNIDWSKYDDSVKELTFDGEIKQAKVVYVYDGDTIRIVFPIHEKFYRWTCRLQGVDTPEIRTKCDIQKEYGYKVRDALKEKILNKVVMIKCGKFDKYGRLLVTIYDDFETVNDEQNNTVYGTKTLNTINDWLIENNYAFSYDGGKKKDWSEYLKTKE